MEKFELRNNVKIHTPKIDSTAFIADGAKVIGDVIMKADSSISRFELGRGNLVAFERFPGELG